MAIIASTDIQWFLSAPHAGSGYSAPGVPGNSLGGFMAVTQVNYSVPLDDVFSDITGTENAAGQVDYQCVFVMNNTATGLLMKLPYVWVPYQLWTGGAGIAIAADPVGPVPYNSTSPQAAVISNSLQAPSGISSWSAAPHTQFQSGIPLGGLPPQYCAAIWIRRTAVNSAQQLPQSFSLQSVFVTDAP